MYHIGLAIDPKYTELFCTVKERQNTDFEYYSKHFISCTRLEAKKSHHWTSLLRYDWCSKTYPWAQVIKQLPQEYVKNSVQKVYCRVELHRNMPWSPPGSHRGRRSSKQKFWLNLVFKPSSDGGGEGECNLSPIFFMYKVERKTHFGHIVL